MSVSMVERNGSGHKHEVVITGAGLVCCLGLDRASSWRGLVDGRVGISSLTALESQPELGADGGQAPPLPGTTDDPREIAYLRRAMTEALNEACLSNARPYAASRCGIVLGTTLHGMRSGGRFLRTGDAGALDSFLSGSVLAGVTKGLGLEGFSSTVCSACSSGLASIALAVTLLQGGQVDLVVAGGYDPVSEYAYAGFNSMRLVTADRIRPFARERNGMKLGEAYGVVVLERAADALGRGATPLARVAGFGEACDAHHLSKPHPDGSGAASAMNQALSMAGIAPREVGMVAAHATSTPDNDAAEFQALSRVFGDALSTVPVTAFKSYLGHTLGGAGAAELILSVSALREQAVPPCANVDAEDVAFAGLQLVTGEVRQAEMHYTLNASLGFGGSNTCIVLGAVRPTQVRTVSAARTDDHEVWITGVGVVLPGAVGNDAFRLSLRAPHREPVLLDTGGLDGLEIDHLLSARRARRMSEYVKLTLAATTLAYRDAAIEDVEEFGRSCAGVLGTAHGSVGFCERYYGQVVRDGIAAANPLLFAEGVPNAGAAHLSTMMSIRGFCQTVIGTRTAGIDALILATQRMRSGVWTRAVVCAADEYAPVVNAAYAHFGLHRVGVRAAAERRAVSCPPPLQGGAGGGSLATEEPPSVPPRRGRGGDRWSGFVSGCGAVALIVERADVAKQRGATPLCVIRETAGANVTSLPSRAGVAAVGRVVAELGMPEQIVSSANGTWPGRVELAGIMAAGRSVADAGRCGPVVGAFYGHAAECFSVIPMAGLAAVLVSGRLPSWLAGRSGGVRRATGEERVDSVGVLATDYSGAVSGLRVDGIRP